ncbi:MAG: hypothetical protein N2042_01290 [Thermodesulfovibrio sp.]|nr:hypothetical protein [Thermodesulfovibrio sp.]MDW7971580.1 hypothetical protein [Thermodesulfovibrio sp.]
MANSIVLAVIPKIRQKLRVVYAKVLLELKKRKVEKKEPEDKKPSFTYVEYFQEYYLKWCMYRQAYFHKMKNTF